jgi:putative component of membrane protein insertase Oxa1/YidC/SpoIIIJ protein YidD
MRVFLLTVVLGAQAVQSSAAANLLNGPWEQEPERVSTAAQVTVRDTASPAARVFCGLLAFFQQVISPVDGNRCPSHPTCSRYSVQAYRKHGVLLGTLMTVDRLVHEASEASFAPVIEVHGVRRIYDPLSANEFWNRSRSNQEHEGGNVGGMLPVPLH